MKSETSVMEIERSPARTFLKSTSHVRMRESGRNHIRSIAVGLQFSIVHLPNELLTVVVFPFLANAIASLFELVRGLIFVLSSAVIFLAMSFNGKLEASDNVEENEEEIA
jgi:hypothetical protein